MRGAGICPGGVCEHKAIFFVKFIGLIAKSLSQSHCNHLVLTMPFFIANGDSVFLATISSETVASATGERIIFDRDLVNPGGHYNPQQEAYTALLNGYYQYVQNFNVHLSLQLIGLLIAVNNP